MIQKFMSGWQFRLNPTSGFPEFVFIPETSPTPANPATVPATLQDVTGVGIMAGGALALATLIFFTIKKKRS